MLPDLSPLCPHLAPVLRKRAAHHRVRALLLVLPQLSPQHPRPALLGTLDIHPLAPQCMVAHRRYLHPLLALLARNLSLLTAGLMLSQLETHNLDVATLPAALHFSVFTLIRHMPRSV
eukprot:504399-Rhodomonas_salina.1